MIVKIIDTYGGVECYFRIKNFNKEELLKRVKVENYFENDADLSVEKPMKNELLEIFLPHKNQKVEHTIDVWDKIYDFTGYEGIIAQSEF